MWALVIIASLILLITLLLLTPVKLHILSDGTLSLKAGVGPIRFDVLKKKKEKIRLKDFSQKKYLAAIGELKKKKSASGTKKTEKEDKAPLSDTVDFILDILSRVETYTGRLKTRIRRFEVTVGGRDPDSAAIAYGVASQTVAYLLEVLDNKTNLLRRRTDEVKVFVDYFSGELTVNADVEFSMRIIDGVKTAIEILMLKSKHETNTTNTRKAGQKNV